MTEKHDYRAVLKRFGNGEDGPVLVYQITDRDIADEEEAIRAALRLAIARQEQEEALERGEAVRVRIAVGFDGDLIYVKAASEAEPGNAILTAIVRKPQPIEIEAEVEQE